MIKIMIYASAVASLIPAKIISIDLGILQLSLFRLLTLSTIVVIIVKHLLQKNKVIISLKKENGYSIQFMILWLIYALLSFIWIKDTTSWIKANYFIGLGVSCVVIYSAYLDRPYDLLIIFRSMFIVILIHNIIGWYEINTSNYLFLENSDRLAEYVRRGYPLSMFGNTNDYATFLMFSIFFIYACHKNSSLIIIKIIYILTIISSVSLIIISSSRANLIGLILGASFSSFISVIDKRKKYFTIILSSIVLLTIVLYPEIITVIVVFIDENLNFQYEEIGSVYLRINLINNGLYFLKSTAFFGVGAGNIEYWMANYSKYFVGNLENIHNWWMEILTSFGVFIFIGYLIFYKRLFVSSYNNVRLSHDKINSQIGLCILCCMIGFIAGSTSSSSNIRSEWLWVFWAIAIAYQGMESECIPKNKEIIVDKHD